MKDEDKTYENERNHVNQTIKTILSPITHVRNVASAAMFDGKKSADLTVQVEMLTKQKKYMQSKCREAGAAVLDLQHQVDVLKKDNNILAKEVDRMNEYVQIMELEKNAKG